MVTSLFLVLAAETQSVFSVNHFHPTLVTMHPWTSIPWFQSLRITSSLGTWNPPKPNFVRKRSFQRPQAIGLMTFQFFVVNSFKSQISSLYFSLSEESGQNSEKSHVATSPALVASTISACARLRPKSDSTTWRFENKLNSPWWYDYLTSISHKNKIVTIVKRLMIIHKCTSTSTTAAAATTTTTTTTTTTNNKHDNNKWIWQMVWLWLYKHDHSNNNDSCYHYWLYVYRLLGLSVLG